MQKFKSGDVIEVIDANNFYFGKIAEVVEKTDYMGIYSVRIKETYFPLHSSKMRKAENNDS